MAAPYRKITPEEAQRIMEEAKTYTILDVRSAKDFKDMRIPGAISLPENLIRDEAEFELPDQDAVIFVYCWSGSKSAGAAIQLAYQGYTNVYDIGGIMSWPYGTING